MSDSSRAGWAVLSVLAGTVAALRAADAVPGLVTDVPRGVRMSVSLAQVETSTGLRLDPLRRALGDYHVAAHGIRRTAPAAVAIILQENAAPEKRILYFQCAHGEIPTSLRPRLPAFNEITVALGPGRSASLRAASLGDGSVWQDLEWSEGAGRAALRSQGRTVELLRVARQIVEEAR